MKRWKAILEEYNHELLHKPGKPNVVADALSRSPLQTHGELNAMTETVLSRKTNSYGGRTNKCF